MTAENETVDSPLPASRGRWVSRSQKIAIISAILAAGIGGVVLSNWLPDHSGSGGKGAIVISGAGIPFRPPAPVKPAGLPMPEAAPSLQTIVAPAVVVPNTSKATSAPIFAAVASGPDTASSSARGPGGGDTTAMARKADADDPLAAALRSSDIGRAKASLLKHPRLTIPAGTTIPCSLQTAINSQLMGFVTCVVASEVRSATGTVTLLDRGTQLFGEIKSGLRRGQDRLFILWVRARTPDNVIVSLGSPAADELGRSGVPGQVDEHFWERFGAAILFSLIEGIPQVASAALQNTSGSNNNTTNVGSFLSPQQQLANTILQDTINIPPTLVKNQGETVFVMVARDLDFNDVYSLEARE